MSTCRGGVHSRRPAHQNKFAFYHNPKSKKTAVILKSPNVGLCQKCWEKVEWRKRYRKYKPLSQPRSCNNCSKRIVTAAYHQICKDCAQLLKVCAWCCQKRGDIKSCPNDAEAAVRQIEVMAKRDGLPLRKMKTLLRNADNLHSNPDSTANLQNVDECEKISDGDDFSDNEYDDDDEDKAEGASEVYVSDSGSSLTELEDNSFKRIKER